MFQFHGCFWHGCFWHGCPKCYRDRATKNTVNGETFDTLYTKTVRRTQQLRSAGFHVIEKWACDFSHEDRQHASELGLESKVPQLVPKDAFYGGRTEAIHLRTTAFCTWTQTVIFLRQPNQWKPTLGQFSWRVDKQSGKRIQNHWPYACGPKNYGYVIKNANGQLKTCKKVKCLRLTDLVEPLVTINEMNAQVERFAKRKASPIAGGPAKQECLVEHQKKQRDITMTY